MTRESLSTESAETLRLCILTRFVALNQVYKANHPERVKALRQIKEMCNEMELDYVKLCDGLIMEVV